MIAEAEDGPTRDALMIAAAQKVEHYEIASYGTIRVWASLLGKNEVAALFEDTLEEEKEADQKLTQIAESFVNQQAADAGEEMRRPMRATRRVAGGNRRRQYAADQGRMNARSARVSCWSLVFGLVVGHWSPRAYDQRPMTNDQ